MVQGVCIFVSYTTYNKSDWMDHTGACKPMRLSYHRTVNVYKRMCPVRYTMNDTAFDATSFDAMTDGDTVVSLTDIPDDLRELIYDKLHVLDRYNFNLALGKKYNIPCTSSTDKHKDRKLAMATLMFKKKMVDKNKLPFRLLRFLSENRDEPTVKSILSENQLVLEDAQPSSGTYLKGILEKMSHGKILLEDLQAIPDEYFDDTIFSSFWDIFDCIARKNSIKLLELVLSEARFGLILKTTKRPAERLMFGLINYGSTKLLSYILEKRFPFVETGVDYVRQPTTAKILGYTPEKVDMLLEYIGLDMDAKHAIYKQAIDNFDIDLILKMKHIVEEDNND